MHVILCEYHVLRFTCSSFREGMRSLMELDTGKRSYASNFCFNGEFKPEGKSSQDSRSRFVKIDLII